MGWIANGSRDRGERDGVVAVGPRGEDLLHHDPDGAMGLIVSAPIGDFPLATLQHQARLDSAGVAGRSDYTGTGRWRPDECFVLHTDDYAASDTLRIGGGLDQRPIGRPNAVHYILGVADDSSPLPG